MLKDNTIQPPRLTLKVHGDCTNETRGDSYYEYEIIKPNGEIVNPEVLERFNWSGWDGGIPFSYMKQFLEELGFSVFVVNEM